MDLQNSADLSTRSTVIGGWSMKRLVTIAELPGRTTPLVHGTVLAQVASSGEYTPLRELALTTGASVAAAVYLGPDIPAATLIAGTTPDAEVVVGDVQLDESRVVFENGRAKTDVIGADLPGHVDVRTIEADLDKRSIYLVPTESMS